MNKLVYSSEFDLLQVGKESVPAIPASRAHLVHGEHPALPLPRGLVVSGDDSITGYLGESLLLCGTVPVLCATIQQASRHLADADICFGLCQDRLPDGKYEELLLLGRTLRRPYPWIIVSRTGGWPEYFEAVELGAYDFMAYPPLYGELRRAIRSLLEKGAGRRLGNLEALLDRCNAAG